MASSGWIISDKCVKLAAMELQSYLKSSAQATEKVIETTLKSWRKEVKSLSPKLLPLADLFIEACAGGKRLRAMLVRLGYELVNNKENKQIYQAAAAVELFQTAILAQDDIVDQSSLRRGRPTIYKALGGDHYAISQTMILGDIGFFLANQQMLKGNFKADNKIKAVNLFSKMIINTGLGEMLDVEKGDVITIFKLKTAYYTFIHPLSVGATLAGGGSRLLSAFEKFGTNLGLAFQIQDDILGVFGDEKTLGKSVTSDIEEGKNTLLITYALEHGSRPQRQILNKIYGKGKISNAQLEKIRQIFIESGALAYSKAQALKYVDLAKKVIPAVTVNKNYQQLLTELADFLINRQK